jgi:hypothetical protein
MYYNVDQQRGEYLREENIALLLVLIPAFLLLI